MSLDFLKEENKALHKEISLLRDEIGLLKENLRLKTIETDEANYRCQREMKETDIEVTEIEEEMRAKFDFKLRKYIQKYEKKLKEYENYCNHLSTMPPLRDA